MNIGQAAKASGVTAKMIRHYEALDLIRPAARTAARYRIYDDREVHTLRFIRRARDLGFSVKEIAALLALWQDQRRASSAVRQVASTHLEALDRKIAELQGMRRTLQHLIDGCHGDHRPDCPILDDLAHETSKVDRRRQGSGESAEALRAKAESRTSKQGGSRKPTAKVEG
jgi:MerR family copper efflux transcriptional regulator